MKLTFALILYNEDQLIGLQLERLYQHAHKIIICEGLVGECKFAWTKERDKTLDIIKSFPDPHNKIQLISKDDWPGKEHMIRAYWEQAEGDYIWHIDADEFYTNQCIHDTIKQIEKTNKPQYGHRRQYYYYKYTNVIVEQNSRTFWNRVARIHKVDKSFGLIHRPQTLIKKGEFQETTYLDTGYQHHYSMMNPVKTKSKLTFYRNETQRYCNVFDMDVQEIIKKKLHVRIDSPIRKLKDNEVETPKGIEKIFP
jgi:hypothetical protein